MPQCQFLFSAVLYFRKVTQEIFSELDETKAKVPIYLTRRQSPKERRRRARRRPHHSVARPTPWPHRALVWAPRPPSDIALPPINSLRHKNPILQNIHPRNILQAAVVVDPRSGGSRSSSWHPAGEGNHHQRPSSSPCLPSEWCVSSPPLDHGSIAVARWLSSPPFASCLDLVSCLSWSRSFYVIPHVVFVGIQWILSTMSSWLLIYHVYVICDLACSPLLVDILAK
jgi:hypothetical protein